MASSFFFFEFTTTPLLEQYSGSGLSISGATSRSVKNLWSQAASFAASLAATYSASIVELAIHDCLMLLQAMTPPPKVNTDPDLDLHESLSD